MSDRTPQNTEIAGIEQATEACWYPATTDGLAFEWGDGCPHWETEALAKEGIVHVRRDADPDLVLRREGAGCWHVSCDECGYRYDEDEWVCHFPDAAEAAGVADDIGWRIVDGRVLCSECPEAVE